jgi:hypothetical protein
MAGVYKLKICPVCNIEHRKRGLYCSASHAAQNRIRTDELKQNISKAHIERLADRTSDAYLDQLEAVKTAGLASKGIINTPVAPLLQNQWIDDHREVIDGDYWIEDGY